MHQVRTGILGKIMWDFADIPPKNIKNMSFQYCNLYSLLVKTKIGFYGPVMVDICDDIASRTL